MSTLDKPTSFYRTGFVYFSIMVLFSLFFQSGHLFPQDDEIRFRLTQSIVENQTLSIESVRGFGTKKGIDDLEYPQYGMGLSIAAIPFYLIGKGTSEFIAEEMLTAYRQNTMRFHPPELKEYWIRHCYSLYNSFIFAGISLMLALIFMQSGASLKKSIVLASLYSAASMILPYGRTLYSEPTVGLCFLIALKHILSANHRKGIILSGLAIGFSLWVRQDSLIGALLFSSYYIYQAIKHKKIREFFTFNIIVGIFGLTILYFNWKHFGNPFFTGYEDQAESVAFNAPILISLYGNLLSPGKSIFLYSPVIIPAAIGLFSRKPSISKDKYILITSILGAYFFFYSFWQNWAGGWDWGPRHIYILVPLTGIFLIDFNIKTISRKAILCLTGLSGIYIQIIGSCTSFVDYYTHYLQSYKKLMPPQFYQALFVPDMSPIAGHFWMLTTGSYDLKDLWLLRLWQSDCAFGLPHILSILHATAFLLLTTVFLIQLKKHHV